MEKKYNISFKVANYKFSYPEIKLRTGCCNQADQNIAKKVISAVIFDLCTRQVIRRQFIIFINMHFLHGAHSCRKIKLMQKRTFGTNV